MNAPSIDPADQRKFEQFADSWWDPTGPFWPLHKLNDFRAAWLIEHMGGGSALPLEGLRILDIGCGGGLASEAMTRAGAQVVGIDVTLRSIEVARRHAAISGLDIEYHCISAEELLASGVEPFDWVLNLEVVEHVANLDEFLKTTSALVRPGGHQVVATINRNPIAWLIAIFGAESVLKLLPKGTHEYHKLVKPSELKRHLSAAGMIDPIMTGVQFNPFARKASTTWHTLVNYMCIAQRG